MNSRLTRTLRWIGAGLTLVLPLVGLSASAILLQHHVAIATGSDPILAGICESAATASCDEVLSSEWGKLLGQPTAIWGFAFFSALFAWHLLIGNPQGRARVLNLVPLFGSVIGAAGCAILAFVMYVKLPKWCPLCAVTHVSTWILMLLNLALWYGAKRNPSYEDASSAEPESIGTPIEWSPRSARSSDPGARQVFGAIALGLVLSFAAWANYHRSVQTAIARGYQQHWAERDQLLAQLGELEEQSDAFRERWEEYHREYKALYREFLDQKVVDIPLSADAPFRGDADAPNTVILFSDVLCPYCAGLEKLLQQQLSLFPGAVRLFWKHFPLDKDCNEKLNRTVHSGACEASWVVEGAHLIGGNDAYWAMLDELMEHRKEFRKKPEQVVNAAAVKIGLDRQELWKIARSPDAHERAARNIAEGQALGLRSTPVVYLNGRRVKQMRDKHFWRFALRDAQNLDIVAPSIQTQPSDAPDSTDDRPDPEALPVASNHPAIDCAAAARAVQRARGFLVELAPQIDPVALRTDHRMKGKKFYREYLNVWWDIYQSSTADDQTSIRQHLAPIVERTDNDAYHNLATSSAREFKQDIISYLSACVLHEQFGFDITEYRRRIEEIVPRTLAPEHLRIRGIDNTMALFYRLRQLGFANGPSFCEIWERPGCVTREHIDLTSLDLSVSRNWLRVYDLTHEIFYLTEFGRTPMQCVVEEDLRYIRDIHEQLIPIFIGHTNVDMVAELVMDLNYLNMTDLPEYTLGYQYLLERQNEDGSWGDHEHIARHVRLNFSTNPDYLPAVGQYLHTTGVTLHALCYPCRTEEGTTQPG